MTAGVTWITLGAAALAGCSFGQASKSAPLPIAQEAPAAARLAPPAEQALGRTQGGGAQPGAPAPGPQVSSGLEAMAAARRLIRTGQITLTVERYPQAAQAVQVIAESHGGYLADASAQRGEASRQHGTLTIRVAAAKFDEAVAALRALGTVRQESVSTQDVGKAYTDLETRLRVKRDTADRLREILRTRTAGLSDVLAAERELARITEEIEQAEGERRFYDQQIALSTLTVALQEPSAMVEAGVFTPLTEAFGDSLRVLATSLAALVYLTVALVPWALVGYVLFLIARRVWRRRKAAAAVKAA